MSEAILYGALILVGVLTLGLPVVAGGVVIRGALESGGDADATRRLIGTVAVAIAVYVGALAGRVAGVDEVAGDLLRLCGGGVWIFLFLLPPMRPLDAATNGQAVVSHLAVATAIGVIAGSCLILAAAPEWWAAVTLLAAQGTIVLYYLVIPARMRRVSRSRR